MAANPSFLSLGISWSIFIFLFWLGAVLKSQWFNRAGENLSEESQETIIARKREEGLRSKINHVDFSQPLTNSNFSSSSFKTYQRKQCNYFSDFQEFNISLRKSYLNQQHRLACLIVVGRIEILVPLDLKAILMHFLDCFFNLSL